MQCHHEISQPHSTAKFSQKKKNIMFHFPCWNKTTQKIKINITRCESTRKFPHPKKAPPLTTPPHRTRVPQRSVAFRPFRKKKKKHEFASDGRDLRNCARAPRPPTWTQGATKKRQKVGFEEQHFWMIWMN